LHIFPESRNDVQEVLAKSHHTGKIPGYKPDFDWPLAGVRFF
jgi:hypothetical protein